MVSRLLFYDLRRPLFDEFLGIPLNAFEAASEDVARKGHAACSWCDWRHLPLSGYRRRLRQRASKEMIRITEVSVLSRRVVFSHFAGKLQGGLLEARGRPSGIRHRVSLPRNASRAAVRPRERRRHRMDGHVLLAAAVGRPGSRGRRVPP